MKIDFLFFSTFLTDPKILNSTGHKYSTSVPEFARDDIWCIKLSTFFFFVSTSYFVVTFDVDTGKDKKAVFI